MMFTGDLISGAQAADWGLANAAVPAAELASLQQQGGGLGHARLHNVLSFAKKPMRTRVVRAGRKTECGGLFRCTLQANERQAGGPAR